ncbi:MAG TPA: response regulator [Aggregatilineales bacterium]|nr:response regulator [Aggregatilineales bacterium]
MQASSSETKFTPTALVVDDQDFNREICRAILEQTGYQVEEAEDGESALQKLEQRHFDMMILDLHMSGMSGYQVLSQVRAKPGFEKLFVIVMTSHGPQITGELHDVANRIMFKPIDFKSFTLFAASFKKTLEEGGAPASSDEVSTDSHT